MISYSKENFANLCESYLGHIENTNAIPEQLICDMMRRFGPVGPGTELFVKLMLLDENDRKALGKFCVYIHYLETGKNILVETDQGLTGEDAECAARQINDAIRKRADEFVQYCNKIEKNELRKVNKKISKQLNRAALLRKEIKALTREIKELQDQIDKKTKTIDKKALELLETNNTIAQLRGVDSSENNDTTPLSETSYEKRIREWLATFGYALTVSYEKLQAKTLGEYEAGSVFSKNIEIYLDINNIRAVCEEDNLSFIDEMPLTIYHEVGHALMEQLLDYKESLPEMDALLKSDFGRTYQDIFDDWNGEDEETIVEDFAYGFHSGTGSLLQHCMEETMAFIFKL